MNDIKTPQSQKRELMMFVFLTVFLAPIMSIVLVGSYGFTTWMYQLFVGPPTG